MKTPSDSPASRKSVSIASAQPDTFEACFSMPAFPAINVGAAKRKTCQKGKFQGITARTRPSGLKVTNERDASVPTGSGAKKRAAFSAK